GGSHDGSIRFAFALEGSELGGSLRQFGFGGGAARCQLGATLFIVRALGTGAISFERELVGVLRYAARFRFELITGLGRSGVLGFQALHRVGLVVNRGAQFVDLAIERSGLAGKRDEAAGQYDAQARMHLVTQAGVTLGLGSLALKRVHLARDFVEDVVNA